MKRKSKDEELKRPNFVLLLVIITSYDQQEIIPSGVSWILGRKRSDTLSSVFNIHFSPKYNITVLQTVHFSYRGKVVLRQGQPDRSLDLRCGEAVLDHSVLPSLT